MMLFVKLINSSDSVENTNQSFYFIRYIIPSFLVTCLHTLQSATRQYTYGYIRIRIVLVQLKKFTSRNPTQSYISRLAYCKFPCTQGFQSLALCLFYRCWFKEMATTIKRRDCLIPTFFSFMFVRLLLSLLQFVRSFRFMCFAFFQFNDSLYKLYFEKRIRVVHFPHILPCCCHPFT